MTAMERHTLIAHLENKGLSKRAACRWEGCSRAVGRYVLLHPVQDAKWLDELCKTAKANPRYGYWRVAVVSGVRFGSSWRLWKQYDFQVAPQRTRKRRKQDKSPSILFDRLANGRQFKTLSILDEFTRECLGIWVTTSILAQDIIAFLAAILQKRAAPVFLRSDNGSEFTTQAVQTWLVQNKVGPTFIPPGQPWKNGFIESFHDKFRDECLQRE